jgi:hypothetical protein
MNRRIQILSILVALSTLAYAQTPLPVIVPANSDAQVQDAKAPSAPEPAASSAALDSAIQLLQQTQTRQQHPGVLTGCLCGPWRESKTAI